ncbi:MAG: branched-chain amino acid ABC transporter permease [Candidatus Bathyarchaeia archaeon]
MQIQQLAISRNKLYALIALAGLVAFPAFFPPSWVLFAMIVVLSDAIVILGFNILVGYAGIAFLIPLFFMAIGAYSAGWLSVNTALHPFISIIIGGIITIISSFLFSLVSTKVKGWFMGLYSFVMFFLIGTLAIQQEEFIYAWTGGPFGIIDIPDIILPMGIAMRDFEGAPYYYLFLGILAVSAFGTFKMMYRSNLGLAIRSVKENDLLAEQLGVNPLRTKIYVFVIASFLMGISAAAMSHFLGSAVPFKYFSINELIHYHFELITGGLGSFTGPVVGSFMMIFYDEIMIYYPPYYLMFKGLLITLTLLFLPLGVMGEVERRIFKMQSETRLTFPILLIAKYVKKTFKKS